MIEVHGLSKSYRDLRAVDDVSFDVGERQLLGLLGPNGAGKTTLLRMLVGTLIPDAGDARLQGCSVRTRPTEAKAAIGYLPEKAPCYEELLVVEQLQFAAGAHGLAGSRRAEAVEQVSHRCGLAAVLHRPVRELSLGFRRRLGIAQALVHDPPILILDEPHSALDPNQMREIRSLLREVAREKAVILSTHLLNEVEALCDRVVLLSKGRVAGAGATRELSVAQRAARRFRMRVRAPEKLELDTLLREQPAVDCAQVLERGDRNKPWTLDVVLSGNQADGSTLFDWAVQSNCRLLALNEISSDLEQVFGELTEQGTGDD